MPTILPRPLVASTSRDEASRDSSRWSRCWVGPSQAVQTHIRCRRNSGRNNGPGSLIQAVGLEVNLTPIADIRQKTRSRPSQAKPDSSPPAPGSPSPDTGSFPAERGSFSAERGSGEGQAWPFSCGAWLSDCQGLRSKGTAQRLVVGFGRGEPPLFLGLALFCKPDLDDVNETEEDDD